MKLAHGFQAAITAVCFALAPMSNASRALAEPTANVTVDRSHPECVSSFDTGSFIPTGCQDPAACCVTLDDCKWRLVLF